MSKLFGLDEECPHDENVALLTTVHDNVAQSILESILQGEKIPYEIKERGSGSAVKVMAGYSIYGTDFFVRKEMLDYAKELLAAMSDPNAVFVDDDGQPIEDKS